MHGFGFRLRSPAPLHCHAQPFQFLPGFGHGRFERSFPDPGDETLVLLLIQRSFALLLNLPLKQEFVPFVQVPSELGDSGRFFLDKRDADG
ncbi:hypothetical protein D1872_291930 [compost metagenome]